MGISFLIFRSYVIDLPAAEISDFPSHPFKVRMDESMMELADSVKQHGIFVPSLVCPMPDTKLLSRCFLAAPRA